MFDEEDYDVGFGKPPVATRFVQGRSGNAKGRPKGSRNIMSIFNKIMEERISVTENGKVRKMSKSEVITRRLTSVALGGDFKAMKEVISMKQIADAIPDQTSQDSPDKEKNRLITKLFAERIRKLNTASTEPEIGEEL
jgi:Family of unknown function (DUF5681)